MKDVTQTEPTLFWMRAFCNLWAGSRDAFCLLFLRGGSLCADWVCWGSGHRAELQQEHCSSSAKHREPEPSSPAELPALNICNSKYEIFVSCFFFPSMLRRRICWLISVLYSCGICHDIVPQMLSPAAWYKNTHFQSSVTAHKKPKPLITIQRSVEENHTLMLYLEEVSMCNFTFISTVVIWCSSSSWCDRLWTWCWWIVVQVCVVMAQHHLALCSSTVFQQNKF